MTRHRSARLHQTGWDEDLAIEDVELAAPGPGEVVVEIEACGVCHRDLLDREGRFPFMRLPVTPGHEAVGRVVETGPGVAWVVGDRVATMHRDFCERCPACVAGRVQACVAAAAVPGLLIDGGYATHLRAPERCFYRAPEDLSAPEAAVLHCTFGTAFAGLTRAGVEPGARVLVTGANGGVGLAAVQVARRLGAEVVAVVRDERHGPRLEALGAGAVVTSGDGRFHRRLPGGPVDVALDTVGEPTFNGSLRSLRPGGAVVVVGNVTAARAELNLGLVVTAGLRILGSAGASREQMAALLALRADRGFEPLAAGTYGLEGADAAQRRLRRGGVDGRLVIVPAAIAG